MRDFAVCMTKQKRGNNLWDLPRSGYLHLHVGILLIAKSRLSHPLRGLKDIITNYIPGSSILPAANQCHFPAPDRDPGSFSVCLDSLRVVSLRFCVLSCGSCAPICCGVGVEQALHPLVATSPRQHVVLNCCQIEFEQRARCEEGPDQDACIPSSSYSSSSI